MNRADQEPNLIAQRKQYQAECIEYGELEGEEPSNETQLILPRNTWADLKKKIKKVTYAWKTWLLNALLTMIAGDTELGKSLLALYIASCYTDGRPWPDGTEFTGEMGEVLWGETESAQALNIARAEEWEISLDKIRSPLKDPLDDLNLNIEEHFLTLKEAAERKETKLIIIDSLRGAHYGEEKSSRTFSILKGLADIARDTGKPVIVLHHLNKPGANSSGRLTIHRVRGSSAIVQPVRMVWGISMPDPEQPEFKKLEMLKNSLGMRAEPIGLRTIPGQGIQFSKEYPEAPQERTIKKGTKEADSEDMLLEILNDKPLTANEIEKIANETDVSWRATQRARLKLKKENILGVKRGRGDENNLYFHGIKTKWDDGSYGSGWGEYLP